MQSALKATSRPDPAVDSDWWRGAVIYQIYPRSYQDSDGDGIGDLKGIVSRLPYIASLGVDAIWISPFFKSPMKDFGYDVSDYCDVDPMFGTLADFDALTAEAHRLGLKVMIDEVLSLYDGPIYGARSALSLNMVDASAILWRLHLGGIDVGDRWQALAANWTPKAGAGNYAFNDVHAMMAFVGAGLDRPARTLLETQNETMRGDDDNAAFTRDVGHPLTLAIKAFGEGDYSDVVRRIRPILAIAHRFGGSHAQRDVIDLTLIEAALRAGDAALAAALTAERALARPGSPLSGLLSRRAAMLAPAN